MPCSLDAAGLDGACALGFSGFRFLADAAPEAVSQLHPIVSEVLLEQKALLDLKLDVDLVKALISELCDSKMGSDPRSIETRKVFPEELVVPKALADRWAKH